MLPTIVIVFSPKSETIVQMLLDLLCIALPLALYFDIIFVHGFAAGKWLGSSQAESTSIGFTATGNNFELN